MSDDPCAEPQPARQPDSCALVLFGATGDLTRRKLVPALYSLATQGLLPESFCIVAFARRPKDDAAFREDVRQAIREFATSLPVDGEVWERFASRVFYHRATLDDAAGYVSLRERLGALDRDYGLAGNRLFYL